MQATRWKPNTKCHVYRTYLYHHPPKMDDCTGEHQLAMARDETVSALD
jgi:hypothetical protein